MIEFTPKLIPVNGAEIAIYQWGPPSGIPILLVHGWPEIAYSWKTQIAPLVVAGFNVIAMDVRGFGNSSVPANVEDYDIRNLIADIEGVLDHLGINQVVLCGHDWGGIIVFHAAQMIPERISHVISICTPFVTPPPIDPITIFRKRHGNEHYFVRFFEDPDAHLIFEKDVEAFFRLMFKRTNLADKLDAMYEVPKRFEAFVKAGAPRSDKEILSGQDLQEYVDAYTRSGFFGGVNLYRNTTKNWQLDQTLPTKINQPVLMISARNDLFLPPEITEQMLQTCPDLERLVLEDCGHWVMWEQPVALSALMVDWLALRVIRTDAGGVL